MLTDLETEQLTGLLRLMSGDDIRALVKTVTNTLMVPDNLNEAVSTILRYSPSVASVLSRKKITKELVFRYLHQMKKKGVEPSMTKSRMIQIMHDHWESDKKSRIRSVPEASKRKPTTSAEGALVVAKRKKSDDDEAQPSAATASKTIRVVKVKLVTDEPLPSCSNSEQKIVSKDQTFKKTDIEKDNEEDDTDPEEMITDQSQVQVVQKNATDNTLQLFSETFIKWFYDLFNKGVAESGQKFGPEHFWPDSFLSIKVEGPNLNVLEERHNGPESSALLAQMRSHFDVILNPNISADGVVAQTETHGLIKIIVCGTAHRKDLCVGFFEQSFLLIRDPTMQNNWRIKKIEMQMKTTIDGKSGQADLSATTFLPMILQ